MLLARKLRNDINRIMPDNDYEFHVRNIRVNGVTRGCSGFIVNKGNGSCVYVNTEEPLIGGYAELLVRYARDTSDYASHSYSNFFAREGEFAEKAIGFLEAIQQAPRGR